MNSKAGKEPKPQRQPIARADLERAIAEVVKAAGEDCQAFVGVIIERVSAASPGAVTNWILKGVRYGKSNREACDPALAACVAEKQREFELSDEQ
jgi:hypothetical protein